MSRNCPARNYVGSGACTVKESSDCVSALVNDIAALTKSANNLPDASCPLTANFAAATLNTNLRGTGAAGVGDATLTTISFTALTAETASSDTVLFKFTFATAQAVDGNSVIINLGNVGSFVSSHVFNLSNEPGDDPAVAEITVTAGHTSLEITSGAGVLGTAIGDSILLYGRKNGALTYDFRVAVASGGTAGTGVASVA